jgi:hypothetical protein
VQAVHRTKTLGRRRSHHLTTRTPAALTQGTNQARRGSRKRPDPPLSNRRVGTCHDAQPARKARHDRNDVRHDRPDPPGEAPAPTSRDLPRRSRTLPKGVVAFVASELLAELATIDATLRGGSA